MTSIHETRRFTLQSHDHRERATSAERRSDLDVTSSTLRDESSDDSTVISSQTSTLTRKVGPEAMMRFADDVDADDVSDDEAEDDDVRFQFGSPKDGDTVRFASTERDVTRAKSEDVTAGVATSVSGPIRRSQTFTHTVLRHDAELRGPVS